MKEINLDKLVILRKEKGYTLKDMATLLDISESYYCQLESGKRNLYYKMAIKIASLFDLKPDDIFYVD